MINLRKQHFQYLIPCIEQRMKVIRNKLYKLNADDWWEYSEDSINSKCIDASEEYKRLEQCLKELKAERLWQETH